MSGSAGSEPDWSGALVEALARAYHQLYRDHSPSEPVAALEWDDLSESLRERNRTTARELPGGLAALGYRVRRRPEVDDGRAVEALPAHDVEVLARAEHVRWVRDRLAEGYVLGPRRDEDAEPPIPPDLIDFGELDDEGKDQDRVRFEAAPRLLAELGYEIVRHSRT